MPAGFTSYYGRPIRKQPTWKTPDVPLYLFSGGMAGASALLAPLAEVTGARSWRGSPDSVLRAARLPARWR